MSKVTPIGGRMPLDEQQRVDDALAMLIFLAFDLLTDCEDAQRIRKAVSDLKLVRRALFDSRFYQHAHDMEVAISEAEAELVPHR